jgi:hypothetical protein
MAKAHKGRRPWWRDPPVTPPGRHIGGRYTHGNAGRAPEWPDSPWFRSRMERNYARFCSWMQMRWVYEPKTFVFESVRSGRNRIYTPDFYLPDEGVYHEVKGWLDKDSQVKLNRMKKFYPEAKVLVIPKPFFEDVERQGLCRLIPHYECKHFPARLVMETKAYVPIPPTPVRNKKRRT